MRTYLEWEGKLECMNVQLHAHAKQFSIGSEYVVSWFMCVWLQFVDLKRW